MIPIPSTLISALSSAAEAARRPSLCSTTRAGRALRAVVLAALVAGAGGCGRVSILAGRAPAEIDRTDRLEVEVAPPRTVVLISVDGLAPWVMAGTDTPELDALAREGTSAVRAETIFPSITLPSHTSMISGVGPEVHGVDWNAWRPDRAVRVPTVFTACRHLRLRCGLFAGKEKFAHFAIEEPGVERYRWAEDAEAVLADALDYIGGRKPHFVMIHLAEVDLTGHRLGWGSDAQREKIHEIDEWVGEFLKEARAEREGHLSAIVTSDHGGDGRLHGGDVQRHMRIPWIAWGDGVPRGARIPRVQTTDTAATILALLGVPTPTDWAGHAQLPSYVDSEHVDVGVGATEAAH